MTRRVPMIVAVLASAALTATAGEITLYENANFNGRNLTLRAYTSSIGEVGFNDRASSLVVLSGRWQVCTDVNFGATARPSPLANTVPWTAASTTDLLCSRVGTTPADVTYYGNYGRGSIELFNQHQFKGKTIRIDRDTSDLAGGGFNDRASSVVVHEGSWELCSDAAYGGTCRIYAPGRYDDLGYGMAKAISSHAWCAAVAWRRTSSAGAGWPLHRQSGPARVILYEGSDLGGRSIAVSDSVFDLGYSGFGDETMSVVVEGGNWMFCSDPNFRGRCRVMEPGQYPRLDPVLQHSISSLRPAGADTTSPPAPQDGASSCLRTQTSGSPPCRPQRHAQPGRPQLRWAGGSLTIWQGHWEACTEADYGGRCAVFAPDATPTCMG